ncbi:MAG: hypothetical protein SLAVMIC_00393 [uncultured marine phage]|uniref:Uncharacterized protein n=1 Tax=uncultured marine phage TaxID=707152 RepID=A0A8D9CC58_9VIRU|nr:MAG: hypothetical protein SLAVMIC_00393 [uncultured marine phage]
MVLSKFLKRYVVIKKERGIDTVRSYESITEYTDFDLYYDAISNMRIRIILDDSNMEKRFTSLNDWVMENVLRNGYCDIRNYTLIDLYHKSPHGSPTYKLTDKIKEELKRKIKIQIRGDRLNDLLNNEPE